MLRCTLAGSEMQACIYNASGCWCTTEKELDDIYQSEAGAVLSKTSTLHERNGNPEPRLYIDEGISVNSMGIPNLGYILYQNYWKQKKKEKVFIQSILAFNEEELREMLFNLNIEKDVILEVNFSCPNVSGHGIIAYNMQLFEKYLQILCNDRKMRFGIKLPPYWEKWQFDQVSSLLKKYKTNGRGPEFITCCNSIMNGLLIDVETESTRIKPNGGLGGLGGGGSMKAVALSNVHQFSKLLEGTGISVVGCGGIKNGRDAFEYILAGAECVQVGTQLLREGPSVFKRIQGELCLIMRQKGYSSLSEFRGKLKNY